MNASLSTANGKPATALAKLSANFPGCKVTATGLVAKKLSREHWEEIGWNISAMNRVVAWVTGDWLLLGESGG